MSEFQLALNTPTPMAPPVGFLSLYPKADGNWYQQDSSGVESLVLSPVPPALVSSVAGKAGAVMLVKADVGLGNVDNTADLAKPISTAQGAVNTAQASTNSILYAHAASATNPHAVSAAQVGAEPANANLQAHVASSTNPHSTTAVQVGAIPTAEKAAAGGVASLDVNSKLVQMPTAADVGLGSVDNTSDLNKPVSTAQAAINLGLNSHKASTNNPHAVTPTQVGLGNVNNTSDLAKPISNLQAAVNASQATTNTTNATHRAATTNPHNVTASQVGAEPKNVNIQAHITSNANPHGVTASQVGATTPAAVDSQFSALNIGDLMNPLVHIPYKRANDELALSGTQSHLRASPKVYTDLVSGLLRTAPINTPCFGRMSDGAIGMRLDGTSTNLLSNSANFSPYSVAAPAAVTPNTVADAFGTALAASTLTLTARSIQWDMIQHIAGLVVGGHYTLSFYLKLGTASNFTMVLNDATAWDTLTASRRNLSAADGYSTTHYKRVAISFVAPLSGRVNLHLGAVQEATLIGLQSAGTVFVTGFQLEALPIATPLITTLASPVTRAGDRLTLQLAGNALLRNSCAIVADCEFDSIASITYQGIIDSGSTNRLILHTLSDGRIHNYDGVSLYGGQLIAGAVHRVALSNGTAKHTYLDGKLVASGGSSNTSTILNSYSIGTFNDGSYPMYGYIRGLRIYDKYLNAQTMISG